MSTYRDDLQAAHERLASIERELAASRADDQTAAETIARLERQLAEARETIERFERGELSPLGFAAAAWRWAREHRRKLLWLAAIAATVSSCLVLRAHCNATDCGTLANSGRTDLAADERLCQCNDPPPRRCTSAARKYELGTETAKNPTKARALYIRGCEHEDAAACAALARLDQPRAIEWLRRGCALDRAMLAQADAAIACNQLGVRYARGEGVPVDRATANQLYDKACKLELAIACRNLGAFERACALGDAPGCASLGAGLEATRPAEAAPHYRVACDARYASACLALGRMHRDGRGVVRSPALAAELFRRACQAGDTSACDE